MSRPIAALFCRSDSIYKKMAGVDVWDAARDARNWPGGCPVVTHPPCRGFGELSHMSNATPAEMALAPWAVEQVRKWGGCLEHPKRSKLWAAAGLPVPGQRDAFGGFTVCIPQFWFGHRAEKLTWIYICGITPAEVPEIPFQLGDAPCVIGTHGRRLDGRRLQRGDAGYRPECTKAEREHTPAALAAWLIEIARRSRIEKRTEACA